ncbi:MAG: hypothetical protein AB1716_00395 [Planctomycetota bacterium]
MNVMPMPVAELEPRLPRDMPFLRVVRPEVGTGRPEERHVESATGQLEAGVGANLRRAIRSAPIWRVREQERCFRLVQPLMVRVRQEEDFFFAENETLRLVATGTNLEEALGDFSFQLTYFHQYYTQIPADKVVGEAKRLKRLYQRIFVEER